MFTQWQWSLSTLEIQDTEDSVIRSSGHLQLPKTACTTYSHQIFQCYCKQNRLQHTHNPSFRICSLELTLLPGTPLKRSSLIIFESRLTQTFWSGRQCQTAMTSPVLPLSLMLWPYHHHHHSYYLLNTKTQRCSYCQVVKTIKVLRHTRHKIGHFGDILPRQSFGLVLKN